MGTESVVKKALAPMVIKSFGPKVLTLLKEAAMDNAAMVAHTANGMFDAGLFTLSPAGHLSASNMVADVHDVELHNRVQSELNMQMDRLALATKVILKLASCHGKPFKVQDLAPKYPFSHNVKD